MVSATEPHVQQLYPDAPGVIVPGAGYLILKWYAGLRPNLVTRKQLDALADLYDGDMDAACGSYNCGQRVLVVGRWLTLTHLDFAALPALPGVYVFHSLAGQVLYIGQSANLQKRFESYKLWSDTEFLRWGSRDGTPVVVKIRLSRAVGEEVDRERRLIKRLRPTLNIQHNTRPLSPSPERSPA